MKSFLLILLLGIAWCVCGQQQQQGAANQQNGFFFPDQVPGWSPVGSPYPPLVIQQNYTPPPLQAPHVQQTTRRWMVTVYPSAPPAKVNPNSLGGSSNVWRPPAAPTSHQPQNDVNNRDNVESGSFKVTSAAPPPPAPSQDNGLLPPQWRDHVNSIISRGIAKFALDLSKAIHATSHSSQGALPQNVVFSPLNLAGAMAMVMLASNGLTFQQSSKILGLESGVDVSRHSEVVHQMFGSLLNTLQSPKNSQVEFASGIFVQSGYTIRPEFKAICQSVYRSDVVSLDFQRRGAEASEKINQWVKQKTKGKISNMLPGPPSPDTTVILASALYFAAEWEQHFMQGATQKKPFEIEPGQEVTVDLMYNGGEFLFHDDPQLRAKILALPYKDGETMMYVVLPHERGARALKQFESTLSTEHLDNMIKSMKIRECLVAMPKMKLSSSLNLQTALSAMGLTSLFNPSTADLSLLVDAGTVNRHRQEPPQQQPQYYPQVSARNDYGQQQQQQQINPRFAEYGYWNREYLTRRLHKRQVNDKAEYQAGQNEEEDVKVVTLEEIERRFESSENATSKTRRDIIDWSRPKRQRPPDEEFLRFMNSQNLQSFGLDALRNNPNLVNPGIYASDVLHKVEMSITEQGTEAAAATSVLLNRSGDYKRMVLKRPFMFFIRHEPTKFVLFYGSVNTPTPHYAP